MSDQQLYILASWQSILKINSENCLFLCIDWLILTACQTHLGLFHAKRLGNRVHIYIFV